MAWCLTAPSHYLKHCWLCLWHMASSGDNELKYQPSHALLKRNAAFFKILTSCTICSTSQHITTGFHLQHGLFWQMWLQCNQNSIDQYEATFLTIKRSTPSQRRRLQLDGLVQKGVTQWCRFIPVLSHQIADLENDNSNLNRLTFENLYKFTWNVKWIWC